MYRRSRSNDGTPNHAEGLLPISQKDLARLLAIFGPEKRPERAPRTFHGPKAASSHPPVRFTDDEVLALRQMREWYGMTDRQISNAIGVPATQIAPITEWRNRVHLDPGPRPRPVEA